MEDKNLPKIICSQLNPTKSFHNLIHADIYETDCIGSYKTD